MMCTGDQADLVLIALFLDMEVLWALLPSNSLSEVCYRIESCWSEETLKVINYQPNIARALLSHALSILSTQLLIPAGMGLGNLSLLWAVCSRA